MYKHNLRGAVLSRVWRFRYRHNLRAVLVPPPAIPVFLALLRGVEDRLQPLGEEADDVRAAEVRIDAAEQGHLMRQPHAQYAIARFCFNAKHARGPKVAGRKGPPVPGRERFAIEQELAIPPFRPIYPEAEEVAVREARPPPPEMSKIASPRAVCRWGRTPKRVFSSVVETASIAAPLSSR